MPGRISVRGRALVVTAALVLAVAALWLLVRNDGPQASADGAATSAGTPVRVDRPAPAFALPLLSEPGSLGLRRYEGSVLVVNFWASWCAPCRTEAPRLEALWRTYRGRGVGFVGIDYDDDRRAALDFVRSLGISYPNVRDPSGSAGDDFGIFGLPTTFIIGSDGRIRYVVTGEVHTTSFRSALDDVLGPAASEVPDR